MTKMIDIQHLKKTFGENEVLKDISATVNKGQVICIIGPSGSGKSTFLRCLNVLEHPTAGKIVFDGTDLASLKDGKELDQLREKMGMVFQNFNLFPNMNVIENVKLAPMKVKGISEKKLNKKAQSFQKKQDWLTVRSNFLLVYLVVNSNVQRSLELQRWILK